MYVTNCLDNNLFTYDKNIIFRQFYCFVSNFGSSISKRYKKNKISSDVTTFTLKVSYRYALYFS